MKILNLTQHVATPEQIEAGVYEPSKEYKDAIIGHLSFNVMPSWQELEKQADALAQITMYLTSEQLGSTDDDGMPIFEPVIGARVMIGGAGFFLGVLERKLKEYGLQPVHAFSQRVSVDTHNSDGTVTKTSTFKHIGFIEA